MFEVITSEASYYHSLQVLIEHFYSAPEFDCSRASVGVGEATETDGDIASVQGFEAGAAAGGGGGGGGGSGNANSFASNRTGSIQTASEVTSTAFVKPVLSPTEKHHLFSNVLLICMASERLVWW